MHPGSDPGTQVKPWVKSTMGGRAEPRAVTRVNPEQASKVEMRVPTRPKDGEGRRGERGNRDAALFGSPGYWEQHAVKAYWATWETRHGRQVATADAGKSRRPWRESERLMVPVKPVTTVEGRGLTSGCLRGGEGSGD